MSPSGGGLRFLRPDRRGVDGALIDLEYQRVELLRFNLFDSSGTYPDYVRGRDGIAGPALRDLARDAAAAASIRASPPWAAPASSSASAS